MRGREKTGRGHAAREHAGPQNAGQTAPSPRAQALCPPALLRYELRRGFGSLGFRLGLLGALAVVLGHLVTSLLPLTRYQDAWQKDAFLAPHSAWLHWIGLDNATRWPTLLAMLLPLLAALPAGRLLRGRGQAALVPFVLFLLVYFAGLWSGWMGQTPMSILLPFQPLTGLRASVALGWPGGALLLSALGWLTGGRRCDAL